MNSKPFIFHALMISVTTVVCLLAAEVGLSLAGYSGEISESGLFLTTDPDWSLESWWHSHHDRQPMPTLQRLRTLTAQSQGEIEIHEHNFTVKKPEGKKRIVFIGDSGTFGSGVKEKDTFVNRVRKSLDSEKYEVINAGIPGFSPTLSFTQFHENLIHLEPDSVIYTMFLANDVLELLDDPYIDKWNRFLPKTPQWLPFQNSALLNFVRISIAKSRYNNSDQSLQVVSNDHNDENGIRLDHNSCTGRYRSYLTPLHPKLQGLWKRFFLLIEDFKTRIHKQDIPWTILIFPTHTTVKGEFSYLNLEDDIDCLIKAGLKYEPDKVDPDLPLNRMLEICEKLELKCINSVPTVKKTLGLDFYIHADDHPNEEGHRVLTEILLKNRELWDPEATK